MSLMIVAIAAFVLWIGVFLFYMLTSRQHDAIEREIEAVRQTLERHEHGH